MLDHIHTMDNKMEEMCGAIKTLGAEVDTDKMPQLSACEILSGDEELANERLDTGSGESPSEK